MVRYLPGSRQIGGAFYWLVLVHAVNFTLSHALQWQPVVCLREIRGRL